MAEILGAATAVWTCRKKFYVSEVWAKILGRLGPSTQANLQTLGSVGGWKAQMQRTVQ